MIAARALVVFGLLVAFAPGPRSLSAHATPPARAVVFARAHRPEPAIAPRRVRAPGAATLRPRPAEFAQGRSDGALGGRRGPRARIAP